MSEDLVIQRPVLAGHTRYRWDKLREQHQLVFPEGMIVLNDSAAAIVRLCDGRSTDEVITALVAQLKDPVPASDLSDDVHECLRHLAERGLLRDDAE
jgi:coenzyme PQQ biosynthesis protein PqqD